LYRRLDIEDRKQLRQIGKALKANADRGLYVKQVVWKNAEPLWPTNYENTLINRLVKRIPAVEEMVFAEATSYIAELISASWRPSKSVTSLRTCRFNNGTLTSTIVKLLAQNPDLRRVELSRVRLPEEEGLALPAASEDTDEEEESVETISAPQVKEVAIDTVTNIRHCFTARLARFLEFFPSARVVSISYRMYPTFEMLEVMSGLEEVASDLRSLQLYSEVQVGDYRIDDHLPLFVSLEHLRLDSIMYSPDFYD
jgi:hypothetical protein